MRKITLFLALLLVIAGSGCSVNPFSLASPIVTGVVTWNEGEAHKYYNEEMPTMYRSVKSALKELNLSVTKNEPAKDGFIIVAGDQDRFKIHVSKVRPHITKVSIRVNYLGDKPYAELVYRTTDSLVDTIEFEKGHPIKGRRLFNR